MPLVAGADEAGRGCLAGPLVAAGVLFDYDALTTRELRALSALNDSKQHTPEAREELYPLVLRSAARVIVVSRCVRGIDARGLHKTNLAALRDALRRRHRATFAARCCACLTASRCRTSGDPSARSSTATPPARRSPPRRSSPRSRATATCTTPTREHPGWSFAEHVGYSTPVHREAILRQGVSPLHRMSFQSLAYQQLAL